MQELMPHRLREDVSLWPPVITLSESDIDRMTSDPQAMYIYSLRTHKRLPGRLHDAMLLFSFNPEFKREVQMYLQWVTACEERETRMEAFRRSENFRDRAILVSMVLVMMAYVYLIVAVAF